MDLNELEHECLILVAIGAKTGLAMLAGRTLELIRQLRRMQYPERDE